MPAALPVLSRLSVVLACWCLLLCGLGLCCCATLPVVVVEGAVLSCGLVYQCSFDGIGSYDGATQLMYVLQHNTQEQKSGRVRLNGGLAIAATAHRSLLYPGLPWSLLLCCAVLCCAVLCCAVLCCRLLGSSGTTPSDEQSPRPVAPLPCCCLASTTPPTTRAPAQWRRLSLWLQSSSTPKSKWTGAVADTRAVRPIGPLAMSACRLARVIAQRSVECARPRPRPRPRLR